MRLVEDMRTRDRQVPGNTEVGPGGLLRKTGACVRRAFSKDDQETVDYACLRGDRSPI